MRPIRRALETDNFAVHGQTTFLEQYVFPFRTPYVGPNSLDPNQGRETWDATLFLGMRLWQGAEFWVNPEIDQGFGLSDTLGVAGFTSGEAYKVGASVPYARMPRAFIRQTIDLGGDSQKVESDATNQFSGSQTANRLVLTVGKFAVTDVFDNNKYAHDPRNDFMNWALIDTGTFDYAADAWGFTYGAAAEWYQGDWTVRGGIFDLSMVPNSIELDPSFAQFQWVGEIERRYRLWGQPGKSRSPVFSAAAAWAVSTTRSRWRGDRRPADTAAVRQYRSRGGVSLNLEQQITEELGVFARAGFANGNIEPYEFTDIDRTAAAGFSLTGKSGAGLTTRLAWPAWSTAFPACTRPISTPAAWHPGRRRHAAASGAEQIVEAYYQLPVSFLKLTLDYQFIVNPAYNEDRGPASVIAARMHAQF